MKNELPASHSGVTAKLTRSSQQSKTPMGNPAVAGISKCGAIHGSGRNLMRTNCRGKVNNAVRMLYDPGHSLRLDNPGLSWDSFSHSRLLDSTRASC